MKVDIVEITPELASDLLAKNTGNFRKCDPSRVKRYAKAMKAGQWMENGDAIRLNGSLLLDGQHRLSAIVESGCTIRSLVVSDLSSDSAKTIDRGQPRSVAQWISHSGTKNAVLVAAISRLAMIYKAGCWSWISVGVDRFTDQDVIQFSELHAEQIQSAIAVGRLSGNVCPTSLASAVMLIASDFGLPESSETCVWFCKSLGEGANLSTTDPVFHLRNRLLEKRHDRKISAFMVKQYFTYCWNKTCADESMKLLRLTFSGPTKSIPEETISLAPEVK